MRRFLLALAGGLSCVAVATAGTGDDRWPEPTAEMKPWAYNWWMASAVDAKGLEHQCAEMADKGFGGFHVIPIYGAKGGYEPKWRKLLSPDWIEAWNLAVRTARKHGLGVDLTMGSGWCFGGPWVTPELGASSGMKVKRAGPGGEGLMIDPYSPAAMSNHVVQFEAAFGKDGTAERPRAFYHDSYEYYGAMPRGDADIDAAQVACFKVWTDWCRANGYLTRNEAHGSPANWLDLYALADVPETEMFGKECRDILISKFASSAAHVKGTTLVSAESCTWLDEHFCERPSEIKTFLDRLFLAGVNHVFYHGLCYSPVEAVWPGWCFYAATEMNPCNPIWREIGALNAYVTRCQSVFQTWTPDNDLAIVWDPALHRADHPTKKGDFRMTIHENDWFYGEKIGKLAKRLYDEGYSFDYVSPAQLRTADMSRYAEVIDPEKDELPRTARRENFPLAEGLRFTRWKKGGRQQFFFVNEGTEDFVVSSDAPFVALDPLNGRIETVASLRLQPGHSIFVRGKPGFCRVSRARPENVVREELKGGWRVAGVCGGPVVPAETNLASLVGWETFDEFFSGTMRYETVFDAEEGHASTLDLGDVREIAHVWLNGHDLGVAFMKPYSFEIPVNVLKAKDNHLVVEVTNLGANRLRWNDLTGVKWKYFTNANMVSIRDCPLDASTWTPHASGLLGPVSLVRSRATPYTHLNYLEDADEFRFAIIPDRYGADYRAKDYHSDYRGGFTNAIRVVNLLRPNFVMSVGDLIPYGWEGEASIRQQHRELKDELKKVVPPFFFVVGNHDISRSSDQPGHERDSEVSTRVWKDNWGPDTYYSFVYGNCLFVALNTIDDRTLTAKHKDISDRQYAWFAKTLNDHPDVRWTFVFMHQPAVWTSPRWLDFELKNLVRRKYTVFAGDWHQYLHVRRHDHDYYVLATAGGCAGGGLAGKDMDKRGLLYGRAYGELDHVMWITMTKSGPVIANIDVTGVLNHDFVNQKTTKSLADMIELGYPPDPEVRRHMDEQKRRKAAIDAGEIPEPQPDESEAGFVPLFNGRDLSGWEGATTNGRFRVDSDCSLVCVSNGNWETKPFNIWTQREYTNFVFRFEFLPSANVNNGVGIRSPAGDYVTSSGMEIQMLEDESSDYYHVTRPLKPHQYNCSLYGVLPAKRQSARKGYLRPLGEWNEEEVRADGSRLTVTLNGVRVVDADLSKIDCEGGTPDGKRHPGLRNASGRICWCWHDGQVKYRNIRIKELK